jgi:hypothetical protein
VTGTTRDREKTFPRNEPTLISGNPSHARACWDSILDDSTDLSPGDVLELLASLHMEGAGSNVAPLGSRMARHGAAFEPHRSHQAPRGSYLEPHGSLVAPHRSPVASHGSPMVLHGSRLAPNLSHVVPQWHRKAMAHGSHTVPHESEGPRPGYRRSRAVRPALSAVDKISSTSH